MSFDATTMSEFVRSSVVILTSCRAEDAALSREPRDRLPELLDGLPPDLIIRYDM